MSRLEVVALAACLSLTPAPALAVTVPPAAYAALEAGEREAARRILEAAAPALPPDGWLLLGVLRREARELDAALAAFDRGLERAPSRRDLALERAVTLSWAGRLEDAEAAYAALRERAPADREARTGWARVRFWRGDRAAAARALRELLEEDPRDADAWSLLGDVRVAALDADGARRAYQRALDVSAEHPDATRGLERAATVTRFELRAGVSAAATNGSWGPAGQLSLRWLASPALQLFAAYETALPGSRASLGAERSRHVGSVGAAAQLTPDLRVAASYRLAASSQAVEHGLSMEGAWRTGPLTWMGELRPSVDHTGRVALGWRAGVQIGAGDVWVQAQVFRWDGPAPSATTAALTAAWTLGAWELRAGGGVGHLGEALTGVTSARIRVALDPRVWLAVGGELSFGPIERGAATLEGGLRW